MNQTIFFLIVSYAPNGLRYRQVATRVSDETGSRLRADKGLETGRGEASAAPPENGYILFPERNCGAMGVYCVWQTYKPYKAMEMGCLCPPVLHLGFRFN